MARRQNMGKLLGADLGPRSTACDWTAKFVLKPITNFEVMGAKS